MEKLAFYDPLTGLANGRLLNEHLRIVIEKARRQLSKSVLLYMDLDDFKRINDSLGHSVGDRLLVQVADRLKPSLTKSETIARIGGDEFVVIFEDNAMTIEEIIGAASILAQKIISVFKDSYEIDGREYKIGVSIGLSVVQGADETADDVLKRADTAMYRSKRLGGNSYTFFDPALQKTLDDKLAIEQGLLNAIKQVQLTAHFQPQVDLHGKIIGAEALVRWIHPERGFIPPLEFIPIAEQFGLINAVQEIVLSQSCNLIKELQTKKLIDDHFSISINISPSQFKNSNFRNELAESLSHFEVSPSQIKLEITESMLIDNVDVAITQMKELKSLGFSFSVDDFGTGYSSLTYLHTFPIDELKIDKSFIDRLDNEKTGIGIVDAIIALSKHLNFSIVAEGVEHETQRNLLAERQINAMQGYLFSKPVPPEELYKLL